MKGNLPKIVVVIVAIIYVISPIDVVPDLIPFVGYLDDVIVGLVGLKNAVSIFIGNQQQGQIG